MGFKNILKSLLLAGLLANTATAKTNKQNALDIGSSVNCISTDSNNITQLKNSLETKVRVLDKNFRLKIEHNEYFGTMYNGKSGGNNTTVKTGMDYVVNESLSLSPYIKLNTDIDVIREFTKQVTPSITLGFDSERSLEDNFALLFGSKISFNNESIIDTALNVGLISYNGNDWYGASFGAWTESIRRAIVSKLYLMCYKQFDENFALKSIFSIGAENNGQFLMGINNRFYWQINEQLRLIFDHTYRHNRNENNIFGINMEVLF